MFSKSIDTRLFLWYTSVNQNRGAAFMINADGDTGLRGKGVAAEKRLASQAVLFGRDENIGATVTVKCGGELLR